MVTVKSMSQAAVLARVAFFCETYISFIFADFDVDIEVIYDDFKREHWRFSGDNFNSRFQTNDC